MRLFIGIETGEGVAQGAGPLLEELRVTRFDSTS